MYLLFLILPKFDFIFIHYFMSLCTQKNQKGCFQRKITWGSRVNRSEYMSTEVNLSVYVR